ncbi:MAG: hypothetical protein DHS20C18_11090 [Saprospiraceae bacterium]|nr:MAG: hypothetical protein DHS20C18_11090 [Saprospiraceae bacterium]
MLDDGLQVSVEFGVNVLQNIISAGYNFLDQKRKEKDFFGKATEKYVKGMIDRYGQVKVLGQQSPKPLLSLYVRANILEKIRSRKGGSIQEMQADFDFDKRSFGKKVETVDGEEIANRLDKFIVLGKPGAGKTTFLRYLALSMLKKQSVITKRRLPIFVTLRHWADQQNSLLEYIVEQFNICGFEEAELFVENMLKQGGCLVLFDGLDEVSQDVKLDNIIKQIHDFSNKYSANQFVTSCRIAAYSHWFEHFTDVEMSDFNEEQIEQFVENWFASEPETGQRCLKRLQERPQLKELSSIPLLLTLLCITYDEDDDFPGNRAELYERALDALLRKWDSSRRIDRVDPYKQLSIKRKEDLFAKIAYETFSSDHYFIRKRDLTKTIGDFLVNMPGFKEENLEIDSVKVLQSIEANHGILVERARNIYSFGHLTFQEYFTAKYIVDNIAIKTIEKLARNHLYDNKWKEVFLLTAGMLSPADVLLIEMRKTNRKLLSNKVLNLLLKDLEKTLLSTETKYPKNFRKTIVLAIVFARARALTHAHAHAHALDLALALALALDGDLDLDHALDLARALDLDLARAGALARALDLKEGVFTLLQGNILIMECLNSDCYVSKEIREMILNTMLEPLTEEEIKASDPK